MTYKETDRDRDKEWWNDRERERHNWLCRNKKATELVRYGQPDRQTWINISVLIIYWVLSLTVIDTQAGRQAVRQTNEWLTDKNDGGPAWNRETRNRTRGRQRRRKTERKSQRQMDWGEENRMVGVYWLSEDALNRMLSSCSGIPNGNRKWPIPKTGYSDGATETVHFSRLRPQSFKCNCVWVNSTPDDVFGLYKP